MGWVGVMILKEKRHGITGRRRKGRRYYARRRQEWGMQWDASQVLVIDKLVLFIFHKGYWILGLYHCTRDE